MKSEDINQARDAIAQRDGRDSSYYNDDGFRYLANNEYVVKSLNPFFGWEATLNECERLHEKLQRERLERREEIAELMGKYSESIHEIERLRTERDETLRFLRCVS